MFSSYQQSEDESSKLLPRFEEFEENHDDISLISRAKTDFTKASATKSFRILFLLFGVVSTMLAFSSSANNVTNSLRMESSLDSFEGSYTCPTGNKILKTGYCSACCPVTEEPTYAPTGPSMNPSERPSLIPTKLPSLYPSENPSELPSVTPSVTPTVLPSEIPTVVPSTLPTTVAPSKFPTFIPSLAPTTSRPTSVSPTVVPTVVPSKFPTFTPSLAPTTSGPSSVSPTVIPVSGLIRRYSFNDGTAKDSVGGYDGALKGGAVVTDGSLILTASLSSYVQLPPNVLGGATSLSIEVWLTNGANTGIINGRMFQIGASLTSNPNSIILYCNAENLYAFIIRSASAQYNLPTALVFNEVVQVERHVVVTLSSVGGIQTLSLYEDGVLAKTGTTTVMFSDSSAGGFIGKFDSSSFINSKVNEFRVWNTALSADVIKRNYYNGPNFISIANTSGLIRRYSFNDGTAKDSVGGYDGTLKGGAVVTGGSLVLTASTSGYVQLPSNVLGTTTSITIEVWLTNGASTGNYGRAFQFGSSLTSNSNSLILCDSSNIYHLEIRSSSQILSLPSSVIFNDAVETEKHMVVTISSSNGVQTLSLYANGVLVKTGTTNSITFTSSAGGYIGESFSSSDPFINSKINEFRVWNTALSAEVIKRNYINGPDYVSINA